MNSDRRQVHRQDKAEWLAPSPNRRKLNHRLPLPLSLGEESYHWPPPKQASFTQSKIPRQGNCLRCSLLAPAVTVQPQSLARRVVGNPSSPPLTTPSDQRCRAGGGGRCARHDQPREGEALQRRAGRLHWLHSRARKEEEEKPRTGQEGREGN